MSYNLASALQHPAADEPAGTLTETQWKSLTEKTAAVFGMDDSSLSSLRSNAVLKLVAAIPYLAECDEPERTALVHMSIFVLAGHPATKSTFSHNFKDSIDVERRLEPISHFTSGNRIIIDWGMKLLMIAMINDHIYDADDDRSSGKMNPVVAGHWDGQDLIDQIRRSMPVFTGDRFTKLMSAVEIQTYWVR